MKIINNHCYNSPALKELQSLFANAVSKDTVYSLYDLTRDLRNYSDDDIILFVVRGIKNYNQYTDLYYASFLIRQIALRKATEYVILIRQFYDRFCQKENNSFQNHILLSIEILENLESGEKCICRILADHKVPPETWPELDISFSYKADYPEGAPDSFIDQVYCKDCNRKWEVESMDSSAFGKQIIWRQVASWEFEFSDPENIIYHLQNNKWNDRFKGSLLNRTAVAIMDNQLPYNKAFRDFAGHKAGYSLIVPYILYDHEWFLENIKLILKDSMVPGFRTTGFSLYLSRLHKTELKKVSKELSEKSDILGKDFVDELCEIINQEIDVKK